MEKNLDIVELLQRANYPIKYNGNYIQCPALYRGGDNPTSVCVYPSDNLVIDFVTGERMNLKQLAGKILGVKDGDNVEEILSKNNFVIDNIPKVQPIKTQKIFDNKLLLKLIPKYDYFLSRGISEKVLQEFKSGLATNGTLRNRFVFPIFNSKEQIIGFSGRAVIESNLRWFHCGQKETWVYPAFINHKDIQEKKEIILVEGIGDVLSLFTIGIRNCLSLFGVSLSKKMLKYLISMSPKKIIISVNNDKAGCLAAEKIKNRLLYVFDEDVVEIRLPIRKDFNDMLIENPESIVYWYKS